MSKITRELLNKRGFPAIQDYHFVNATEESDSVIRLRKIIIKESLHFKVGYILFLMLKTPLFDLTEYISEY